MDTDHSGKLDKEELFSLCSDLELGVSDEKLAELIKATDADGSGDIDVRSEANPARLRDLPSRRAPVLTARAPVCVV